VGGLVIYQLFSLIFPILFGAFTLAIGLHALKSIRRMTGAGTAYLLFDWRCLFGAVRQDYSRDSDRALYSITIFQNAFIATIMLCFACAMLLMLVFSFVEMFAAK
jgi:hypothetical protein